MSKYLFVVPPFFGHISPTLSVGAGLLAEGHEVAWVGLRELADRYIPAGGRWIVPHRALEGHAEEIGRILKRQDDGPSLSGPETLKLALEETYLPICRLLMKGLPEIVDAFGPDVIVSDCISFAGGICAFLKGIPYATTTPVPPNVLEGSLPLPKVQAWQQELIFGLQSAFGIHTDRAVIHSDRLNLVFTSREFAGWENPPPYMRFVGPVSGRPEETAFEWDRLERMGRPGIFISLGTLLVDVRRAFFDKMVEAFGQRRLTIVAATDPGIREDWPDNFIVQAYVPQAKVMEKMDVAICHGGFNTIHDAILHRLPILITPIAYDHFHTASLIERSGCGISIRYKRLRAEAVGQAVEELLENDRYAESVETIRNSFLRAGGRDRAVEYLLEMTPAPAMRAIL